MERAYLEQLQLPGEVIETLLQEQQQWQQQYEQAVAQREQLEFQHALELAIHRQGGRNVKAISALLDLEQLQLSRDRDRALAEALQAVKQQCGYLFAQSGTAYAPGTGTEQSPAPESQTLVGALRERFFPGRK